MALAERREALIMDLDVENAAIIVLVLLHYLNQDFRSSSMACWR